MSDDLFTLWSKGISFEQEENPLLHVQGLPIELSKATVLASKKLENGVVMLTVKEIVDEGCIYCISHIVENSLLSYTKISDTLLEIMTVLINHKVKNVTNILENAIEQKFQHIIQNYFYSVPVNVFRSRSINVLALKKPLTNVPSAQNFIQINKKTDTTETVVETILESNIEPSIKPHITVVKSRLAENNLQYTRPHIKPSESNIPHTPKNNLLETIEPSDTNTKYVKPVVQENFIIKNPTSDKSKEEVETVIPQTVTEVLNESTLLSISTILPKHKKVDFII